MKDIQAIITKRAEGKLEKDIRSYLEQIKNNPLFFAIKRLKIIHQHQGGDKQTELGDFFSAWAAKDIIFNALRDNYVETESDIFMAEFDRLKDDLDSLLNQ